MGLFKFWYVWELVQLLMVHVAAIDCDPEKFQLFTIESAADIAELTNCPIFAGNITITGKAPEEIHLDGLKIINGSLKAVDIHGLRSISSKTLLKARDIILIDLPELSTLSFPALDGFRYLRLINLPSLDNCTLPGGKDHTEVMTTTISRTALQSLKWLEGTPMVELNISSNAMLESFDIPTDVVRSNITIQDNRSLKKVDVSSIRKVSARLDISGNGINTFSFDNLDIIEGIVELNGDITNISIPALRNLTGMLNIRSTADISEVCVSLGKSSWKQHYECSSDTAPSISTSPLPASSSPSSSDSAEPSQSSTPAIREPEDVASHLTVGAMIGIGFTCLMLIGFLMIGMFFFWRARSRRKVLEIVPVYNTTTTILPIKHTPRGSENSFSAIAHEATLAKSAQDGGVRLQLNGNAMKEVEDGTTKRDMGLGRNGVGSELSLSVSSWSRGGSEVSLLRTI